MLVITDPNCHAVTEWSIPDASLFVASCKLSEALSFGPPSRNSYWQQAYRAGMPVLITIHSTGSEQDCMIAASRVVAAKRPICNLRGHTGGTAITCVNTGQVFRTQSEAAHTLGLNQSNISQHLRGRIPHVKGYTFIRG